MKCALLIDCEKLLYKNRDRTEYKYLMQCKYNEAQDSDDELELEDKVDLTLQKVCTVQEEMAEVETKMDSMKKEMENINKGFKNIENMFRETFIDSHMAVNDPNGSSLNLPFKDEPNN